MAELSELDSFEIKQAPDFFSSKEKSTHGATEKNLGFPGFVVINDRPEPVIKVDTITFVD